VADACQAAVGCVQNFAVEGDPDMGMGFRAIEG
jgi:hypothetical protein